MKHIFIINPMALNGQVSRKIRKKLEEIKAKTGFDYLVFDSEYQGHEKVLAERICTIFSDEPLRFYACGGSGTFQRMLSGITNLTLSEAACCPLGLTNDFIKCFGADSYPKFMDIEKLISGSSIPMDIIELNGEARAVNTLSIGFESCFKTFSFFQDLSMINKNLPYTLMPAIVILKDTSLDYLIDIDGQRYDGKYVLLHFANGICFGSNMYPLSYAVPDDGRLEIMLFKANTRMTTLRSLKDFAHGNTEKIGYKAIITDGSQIHIKRADGKPIIANIDGEAIEYKDIKATLLHKKLNFIVPDGVSLCRTQHNEHTEAEHEQ